MPDRKIDESPMLAQVQADENVAGSRVRKEAQRAADRTEQRAGRQNVKGVPRREVPVNGEHRGWAVGPVRPAPAPAAAPEGEPVEVVVKAKPSRKARVRRCSPNIPDPQPAPTPPPVVAPKLDLEEDDSASARKSKKRRGKLGLRVSGLTIGDALRGAGTQVASALGGSSGTPKP